MKLSTKREIEIKPLTMDQRLEIDEAVQLFFYQAGKSDSEVKPFPYRTAMKAIRYSAEEVPEDLSNQEIAELYNAIFDISHKSEIEKKS